MRARRLVLAMVVTGTVTATGVGAAVNAAPSAFCGDRVHTIAGGWQVIKPAWTSGPATITQLVSPAYSPDRMYATNGVQVLSTADAGCTWHPIAAPVGGALGVLPSPADDVLRLPSTAHVVAIAAPSSATASDRIYVAWNDDFSAGLERPHVTVLDTSGTHEASGLPRFGTIAPLSLSASANVPTTAYLVVDPQLGSTGGVYGTQDGGMTWTARDPAARSATVQGLRADPVINNWVYARALGGLAKSIDGGMTFHLVRSAADATSFDIAGGAGAAMLVLGHSQQKSFDRSNNGAAAWDVVRSPVVARDVAMQPILDHVAVSDGRRLFVEQNGVVGTAQDITPSVGVPDQVQITAPSAAGYAIVGIRGATVLRRAQQLSGVVIISQGGPVRLLPHVLKQFPSTLTPGKTSVTLPAGGHQDVSYQLLLPRTPSPVDIMFLVDTTASMDKTINGLKDDLAGIVNDIAQTGLNAEFGVADFKDYSSRIDNLGDGDMGDYPYRLDRRIGPANSQLRAALDTLRARGGGDPPEADLTALYQSTTGAGQHFPGRKSYIQYLEPGQSAGYRPDALRLAVLATDERFHTEKSYLTPSWDETVAALRAHGVHPISLAVQTVNSEGKNFGFHSLGVEQKLARATGSLAPAGGVDCNGDLVPDIPAGAPFVCKVPVVVERGVTVGRVVIKPTRVLPIRLGPAVTRAADTLPDLRSVDLQFRGGQAGLATVVTPAAPTQVNLRNDNALTYTVRYSCPRALHAHTYSLHVDATAGARVVASSLADVSCGAVTPQKVVPPAAVLAAPVAAAAAPPPAPGQPIPNTNPNPNPGLNANVGFASQEEEQRQLAFAGADSLGEEDTSVEYQMSRLSSSGSGSADSGEPWLMGGAAALLTGAAGYAARSRFAAAWHRS